MFLFLSSFLTYGYDPKFLVPEPAGGLIMSSRPKGLKVYSYVKKYAEFKNQTLKKIGWYIKLLYATDYHRGELNLLTA